MDRTERQKLAIRRWINAGGRATLVATTGFGKTRCSIMLIQSLCRKNKDAKVLIGVPTEVLKEQWIRELVKYKLFSNCEVGIFNTIIKNTYNVDLFIIDEVHLSASPANIYMYECVSYKYLLGLTATWERLDDGHIRLERYMSICDIITLQDALENGWISPYRNYKVWVEVDMSQYNEINRKFQQVFAVFGNDFKLIMYLVQNPKKVKIWAQKHNYPEGQVRGFLAAFMKLLKQRKSFVMSHPKKFEIANRILDARKDKKCIIFSSTVKDAESFKHRAIVLHSKKKKAENKKALENFNALTVGVISAPKCLETGVDVAGLSVGIKLTCNSSETTNVQSIGRVVRKEEGKSAEIFTLVIKNSIEETWFNNANRHQDYITINEDQLDIVLQTGKIETRKKVGVVDLENRY